MNHHAGQREKKKFDNTAEERRKGYRGGWDGDIPPRARTADPISRPGRTTDATARGDGRRDSASRMGTTDAPASLARTEDATPCLRAWDDRCDGIAPTTNPARTRSPFFAGLVMRPKRRTVFQVTGVKIGVKRAGVGGRKGFRFGSRCRAHACVGQTDPTARFPASQHDAGAYYRASDKWKGQHMRARATRCGSGCCADDRWHNVFRASNGCDSAFYGEPTDTRADSRACAANSGCDRMVPPAANGYDSAFSRKGIDATTYCVRVKRIGQRVFPRGSRCGSGFRARQTDTTARFPASESTLRQILRARQTDRAARFPASESMRERIPYASNGYDSAFPARESDATTYCVRVERVRQCVFPARRR